MEQERILVVDDEQIILDVFTEMLTINGFNVDTAETGTQALKKIEAHVYAVIIVNIKLPDMSGSQICKYVKDEKDLAMPVVGMTGASWLSGDDRFDAVLLKPFSEEDLKNTIAKLMT